MTDFNLSKRLYLGTPAQDIADEDVAFIKEFIRLLKDTNNDVDFDEDFWEDIWTDDLDKNEIVEKTINKFYEIIDKLAGPKLT